MFSSNSSQVSSAVSYIEDVFSTFLYTGDGSSAQNINNGIDLAGEGGMVWVKGRSDATTHVIVDTNRFVSSSNIQNLFSDSTAAASASANEFGSFNSNGFSIPYNTTAGWTNFGTRTFCSWTFREQAKFFDVVTWSGDGTTGRVVNHSLGSEPGCIIVKLISSSGSDWQVWHRNDGTTAKIGYLNLTSSMGNAAYSASPNLTFLRFAPTATDFTLKASTTADANACNASGQTYVAYLFAHDAGGFGLAGTDNVISCGSFTASGGQANITLGYEPQWVLIKQTNGVDDWYITDSMREFLVQPLSATQVTLKANLSAAEADTGLSALAVTSTGFFAVNVATTGQYIYIAIRRGPMKVPTLGTSVFAPVARAGTGATGSSTSFGQVTDLTVIKQRSSTQTWAWTDRLRGATQELTSAATTVETAFANDVTGFDTMTGFTFGTGASGQVNTSAATYSDLLFKRAPGFFDEVCYTGTASNPGVLNHNLSVVPELMIVKCRSDANYWAVYTAFTGNTKSMLLPDDGAASVGTTWSNTSPTATTFTVENDSRVFFSGLTYVAYLFATCAGVSKVGSYTGNGTTQTINCGFTGGARFVLIKRTNATGDWYVYDTARGMTVLTDPYLLLNTTAAEVATLGSVTTVSTGFALNSAILAAINISAGTYIFLAIA